MDRSEESLAGVRRPGQPSEDAREHSGTLAEFNGAQAGEIVSVAPADTLLSLISRALAALEGARTLAETVHAMKLAQAAKELGRIVGAANEARADCLRVELLAQMRIAREYAGAQVRGEVAKADGTTHHRPKEGVPGADTLPATVGDLGLDRRRLAEWRKMVDAGEDVVLGAISDALDEGREATAADVKRAISGGPVFRYFTGNTEWYTPGEFVEAARQVMGGIDLDPASCALAQETVRADEFYTEADDGLAKPWRGRVWLNPPYSVGLVDRFVAKLVEQYQAGNVSSAVVLTDNRTDTAWFHALAASSGRICFTRRRIHFRGEGISVSRPANGSAFFYLGSDPSAFDRVFSRFGLGAQIVFTHDGEGLIGLGGAKGRPIVCGDCEVAVPVRERWGRLDDGRFLVLTPSDQTGYTFVTIIHVDTGEAEGFSRPMLDTAIDSVVPQMTGVLMPNQWIYHLSARHHVNPWLDPEVGP